jgi:hypothetical protein
MAVIFTCPGVSENGHGATATVVHALDCCAQFARVPADRQQEMGLRVPAPDVPAKLSWLRPHAVAVLNACATGRVWWVVQHTATYGHIEGRRVTKVLRTLAAAEAIVLPATSGVCLATDVGKAALLRYPDWEKQDQRP